MTIVGVSDPDPVRAAHVGRELGVPSYVDPEQLLETQRPDFAFAFAPHVDMPALGAMLVDAEVPFVIEKPPASRPKTWPRCAIAPGARTARRHRLQFSRQRLVQAPARADRGRPSDGRPLRLHQRSARALSSARLRVDARSGALRRRVHDQPRRTPDRHVPHVHRQRANACTRRS